MFSKLRMSSLVLGFGVLGIAFFSTLTYHLGFSDRLISLAFFLLLIGNGFYIAELICEKK